MIIAIIILNTFVLCCFFFSSQQMASQMQQANPELVQSLREQMGRTDPSGGNDGSNQGDGIV